MKSLAARLDWSLPGVKPRAVGRWLAEQFQEERDRWPLWAPVFIGLGVGGYFSLSFEPSRFWLLLSPLFAGLCFVPFLRRWRFGLVLFLLIAMGVNAGQFATWRAAAPMLRRDFGPVMVTGRVVAIDPKIDGITLQLDQVAVETRSPEETPRQVRIRLRREDFIWPPIGSYIALSARLTAPREPAAPGAYDFRRHAFFSGVGAQGFARAPPSITAIPPQNSLSLWVENLRSAIAEHVLRVLSGDKAQIAIALLNGAQSGISPRALDTMRASGLQHILSISGLHLAIVAAFLFVGLRGLLALWPYAALHWPIKKIAAALALVNLAAYTLLVGAPVPAVRSAIMTALVMTAILFDRRALSLRTVAIAAIILLLAAPEALTGASFQMSFAAVTVMVSGFEALRRQRRERLTAGKTSGYRGGVLGHAGSIVFTSVLAGAATAPFTLYNFQQMNWYGVIANMAGIPLTSFWIMPAGFLAYFLMPFGLDGWALKLMGSGIGALLAVADFVASWPGASINIPAPPDYALPLIVIGGLWLCLWQRAWRLLGVFPLVFGMMACFWVSPPDLYIAADWSNWAVRDMDGSFIARKVGERNFTIMQWKQREGGAAFKAKDAADRDRTEMLRCDSLACVYAAQGQVVSLATSAEAVYEDCGQADIILTPLWRIRCPEGSRAVTVLDGRWFKYHGAATLRLLPDRAPDVKAVRASWRARPWTPGWRE